MKFLSMISLSIGLFAAMPSNASPLEERSAESANHLESRATRSSAGWYSYGCYFDCYDGMHRFLPVAAYVDANNNPDMCIQACSDKGHNYAGLQFGGECYCGDELAGPPAKPEECDHRCADGKNKCGGPCRNNIWSSLQKPGH